MFTGIVTALGRVAALGTSPGLCGLTLDFPPDFARGLVRGASVAVDGVCLTVTAMRGDCSADFDVIAPSLAQTTLATLRVDQRVNLERASREGAEVGGHPLSGHVDCTGTVTQVHSPVGNRVLRIAVSPPFMRYLFARGYVAIDGASLTIARIDRAQGWFEIWLVPETIRATTLGDGCVGDAVNIEIDRAVQVVVDTLRDALEERLATLGASAIARLDGAELARLPRVRPDRR